MRTTRFHWLLGDPSSWLVVSDDNSFHLSPQSNTQQAHVSYRHGFDGPDNAPTPIDTFYGPNNGKLDGSVEWVPRDELQHKWPKFSHEGFLEPAASYNYLAWY